MSDALRTHVSHRHNQTPQSELARPDQVKNNAGGFVFEAGEDVRLHRFLTIGTEGGTFHVGEKTLTKDNAGLVIDLAKRSDFRLIEQAVKVSVAGRAPSNDPALFALAAAAGLGDTAYRQLALDALPQVARIGTHILDFTAYVELFRGWGPQLVKGIRGWYLSKDVDDLAYQVLKYKSRNKWAQADLVRLAGFKAAPKRKAGQRDRAGDMPRVGAEHEALLRYVAGGAALAEDDLPQLVYAAEEAHAIFRTVRPRERQAGHLAHLIASNRSLSWEMLPSEALAEPEVWRALVENGNVPLGALIRQLPRLTSLGLLKQGKDQFTGTVSLLLQDHDRLRKARVHPITVLLALRTYASGHGVRSKATWAPVRTVTDALDAAFYEAFDAVTPAGNRVEVALDISGTMSHPAGGLPMSCREVVAAMAQVVIKTEPYASIYGFGHNYQELDISPRRRMDDNMRHMVGLGMQRTDCAVPMTEALRYKREVDVFQIWTDNETWAGPIHVHQALENYRQATGINARLQVVCIVPTEFSVADPLDPRQLDVSGFDSAVPNLLTAHARGDL